MHLRYEYVDLWATLKDQAIIGLQDVQRQAVTKSHAPGEGADGDHDVFDPRRFLATVFVTEKADAVPDLHEQISDLAALERFDDAWIRCARFADLEQTIINLAKHREVPRRAANLTLSVR